MKPNLNNNANQDATEQTPVGGQMQNFKLFEKQMNSPDTFANSATQQKMPEIQNLQNPVLLKEPQFKQLITKVNKLSNNGWSYHLRVLRMDAFSLGYFKHVPKDFDEQNLRCPSIENKTNKAKQSIPIKRIIIVDEIQGDDMKKYKKLTKAQDIAFKIAFDKKYLVKGDYQPKLGDDNQEVQEKSSDGDQEDQAEGSLERQGRSGEPSEGKKDAKKSKKFKSKSKSQTNKKKQKKLKEWYFVCESKQQQQLWRSALKRLLPKNNQNGNNGKSDNDNASDEDKSAKSNGSPFQQQQQIRDQQLNRQAQGNQRGLSSTPNANQSAHFRHDQLQQKHYDPEFFDLNEVLQQNLNINNVNLDQDGNINDQNLNTKANDDNDDDLYFDNNQDAKERLNRLKNHIDRYYKASQNLQEKKTKKEQKGWDLKFQNYWGYLISSDKNLKDSMTLSERFFDHVGNFRKTANDLFREIVDEMHKPVSLRKYKPQQKVSEEHSVFLDDDESIPGQANSSCKTLFYCEKNICIKVTSQGEQVNDNFGGGYQGTASASRNSANYGSNSPLDMSYNQGTNPKLGQNPDPFQNHKWKQYGREFLSMDIMFDALFLLSKPESDHKLRVPLSALVDYKGFRALAVGSIPIQPQLGPSIGFYTDGKYVPHDRKLKQELVYVGDILNLKENRICQKGQSHFESVPISFFIKVYNYQQPESKNKGKDPDTPTKKSQDFHFSELQYLEEPFYVLKSCEIFPFDLDANNSEFRNDKFLRPEFMCNYERPLKADAAKDLGLQVAKETKQKDDDNDQVELHEASRYLRNTVVPNLVNLLDSLTIIPIDSESMEMTFHSQGVNFRYLGLVTSMSIVPHVRDICINEMIARTCKNILNKQLASIILDHQRRFQENEDKRANLSKQRQSKNLAAIGMSGKRNNQQHQQLQQQELEQKERELQEEHQELKGDMDEQIKISIIDYMNLIFGIGQETDDFWDQILFPYASAYFNYPYEELVKPTNLNGLYFSFIYLFGLKMTKPASNNQKHAQDLRIGDRGYDKYAAILQQEKEDDFFKEFGRSEMPFGVPEKNFNRIKIVGRSKTYGLRNLPYKLLADKYKEYKNEGKIENSLKCCRMRKLMKRLLEDKEDVATIADVCETSLQCSEFKIAKEQAIEGLKHVHPLHAEAIKFYCILMRAFYGMEMTQETDQYFSKSQSALVHHWGDYHPLHTTIYGIMAYLLITRNRLDDASYLYQSSLICSQRVLGPNHIQTAEVHMDYGRLYLKMRSKDESLQHFEQAFLIYESYFGISALPTAQAAMQIATILEEQGKLNDAFSYVQIAAETYSQFYGEESEISIIAQWLQLSIAYSLKNQNVILQCRELYESLTKRDKALQSFQVLNDQDAQRRIEFQHQEFEERIQKIKELCIVTTLLEMTRTLEKEDKYLVKSFCDKVLFRAYHRDLEDEDLIPSLSNAHQKDIDPLRVISVTNLKFEESGRNYLSFLYEHSKELGGFADYYSKILSHAISSVQDAKKAVEMKSSGTKQPGASGVVALRSLETNLLGEYLSPSDEPKEFFWKVLKTFEHINFYNVLIL